MWSASIVAVCAASLLQSAVSTPIHRHYPHQFPSPEIWPAPAVGKALEPQMPGEDLQAIIAQISRDNIEATIRKLASFGTRHTLSSQTDPNRGIGAARTWLTARFQEAAAASEGRMTVDWNSFIKYPGDNARILFPVNITTVVATLKGSEDPDRYYITGGHYDSRNSDPVDYQGDAPGAVDDASGVAVSLELARIFAHYKPKSTIVFTAFAGEEQGLLGAENLAQTYKNASTNVAGMINLDMVVPGGVSRVNDMGPVRRNRLAVHDFVALDGQPRGRGPCELAEVVRPSRVDADLGRDPRGIGKTPHGARDYLCGARVVLKVEPFDHVAVLLAVAYSHVLVLLRVVFVGLHEAHARVSGLEERAVVAAAPVAVEPVDEAHRHLGPRVGRHFVDVAAQVARWAVVFPADAQP
ncbi:uncharacterized protein SETTUDRAFT_29794 [Exserohilum turcica Et28A]|uniref:Peptide hydrolase n=1 Tax=Exserohilum turcicum (strain 28A) TaxID=671987 RepID=R0J3C9_EXST2|nr:uncharacterized protein SETTUDRAFT_29794 [Exserohilum turcica Et28A]EOA91236.1 hypothetical protein SETTUDRAFT_29794 [Exserohilum turcica Et28A]